MPEQVTPQELSNFDLEIIRRAADHRPLLARFEQLYEVARQEVEQ
jgi:hypothetical protein